MGIKKIARPMNKRKNQFIKWLLKNNAENIYYSHAGENPLWDCLYLVNAHVGGEFFNVSFLVSKHITNIECSKCTKDLTIVKVKEADFLKMIES